MKSPRIALLLSLLLSLAGCGEDRISPPPEPPAVVAPSAPPASPVPEEVAPAQPSPAPEEVAPAQPSPVPEEVAPLPPAAPPVPETNYPAGEDPAYARQCGWPVVAPAPLPGAILPETRIVAYYGNPNSRRMGALGEYEKDEMLLRLDGEVARWQEADPQTPVQPALHLVAVVAQGEPGTAGKYRKIMEDRLVNEVYGWARAFDALLFLDIQTGHDDIRDLLPRFEWILRNPDVHLGIDPEFNLVSNLAVPGTRVGTFDAEEVNYATAYLAELVRKYDLPPKVLTVHRFTRGGVTNAACIDLRPEVQVVMHMDGWGPPCFKRATYKDCVVSEPVQFAGFKLFYHNDTKRGDPLMTPEEVLRLTPQPVYIQYQ